MGHYKLSIEDLRILGALELNADRSLTEIASDLGRHSVALHRRVQRFIDQGVIVGKTAILDVSKLGLIEYGFYLTLGARSEDIRLKLLKYLQNVPGVSWVAEVGGAYDIAINLLASHPREIQNFLEDCNARFPELIVTKRMVQRTTRIRYFRGYLKTKRGIRFRSGESQPEGVVSLQEQRVIRALNSLKFESLRDLARAEGMSIATFTRIVRDLKRRKILLGFGYRINTELLGRVQFRALVSFKNLTKKLVQDLETQIAKVDSVKLLLRCIGEWDYEVEFDVDSPRSARDLSSWFWERYGSHLSSIQQIPVFEHIKYISFGTRI